MIHRLFIATSAIVLSAVPTTLFAQGKVIVRVDDPFGSHCIDALTENVTIHVRRVFMERTKGLVTEDNRAGVQVKATLKGRSNASTGGAPSVDVDIPSVNLVSIADEALGRISVPLEYEIANYLALTQGNLVTDNIRLDLNFAKTRGKNTFGTVLDLAGKALNQLPIPSNPFFDATNKILKFANDAVDQSMSGNSQSLPFGTIDLAFRRGPQPDLGKCGSEGKERTGAFALMLGHGLAHAPLVPVTNTDRDYCFSYSSANTYELLAAKRTNGNCPTDHSAFSSVNNDYVMFLLSAASPTQPGTGARNSNPLATKARQESEQRCKAFHLKPKACGLT